MANVTAYHSKLEGTTVFHDESECNEGNSIPNWDIIPGKEGKKRCDHCERLRTKRLFNLSLGIAGGLNPFLGRS